MASSAPVDMELKKAFQELQVKCVETSQKMKLSDIQIDNFKRAKQHAILTRKEVVEIPHGTPVYKQIGRVFVLNDRSNMLDLLEKKSKNSDVKIAELQNNKKYLEKSIKESEENLRELVASKQKER